ncbi:MAG: methionine--tRNA ligase subunit beta [Phycisphaeraceae bacterium]|nr:methionine--tRNA ligase subunit beta [Phycisphaeraceae bacterium]
MTDASTISFDDFLKLDLRVATITEAELHPNADRLLKLQLDDGGEGRQICAGIRGAYEPEALVGRQIIIVANLEPRTIRGEISEGMLLAASEGDEGEPILLQPDDAIAAGARVG